MGGGNTVYSHLGPVSKGQRGGWNKVYTDSDLYLKIRGEVGTQCTHIQDLYLNVRGEGGDSVHTLMSFI